MKKSFKLDSDCLGIVKRLRAIDKNYFVLVNAGKFELHHCDQKNSYCLTFPFDRLDERAVVLTLKSRVQNADEIFEQMEKHNQQLRERQVKEILNDFKEKMYDS